MKKQYYSADWVFWQRECKRNKNLTIRFKEKKDSGSENAGGVRMVEQLLSGEKSHIPHVALCHTVSELPEYKGDKKNDKRET